MVGKKMIIKAIKLQIFSDQGEYGFFVPFSRNLTVIRGNNSSGKSTLFNSLLYSLGMEELVGGRGEKFLTYAVKESFETDNGLVKVNSSAVYLEIENTKGEVITIRRSIVDPNRNSKLVEILNGPHLTGNVEQEVVKSTYLFDPGSAIREEGFHHYLEVFLGLNLPKVASTNGGETKLYLQTIFASLAVEQKRGWSDYITNIPFYGIRDARTRVVEFLLNLNVFEVNALKNQLDSDSIKIANEWDKAYRELQQALLQAGAIAHGVPRNVSATFDSTDMTIRKRVETQEVNIAEYIPELQKEFTSIDERTINLNGVVGEASRKKMEVIMSDLQRLAHLHETISAKQTLQQVSLQDYRSLLAEEQEDLSRNKAALKLRTLGARSGLITATDHCPTCAQPVADSLLAGVFTGPLMDLDTNINYLDRQCKMLIRQISGIETEILQNEASLSDVAMRLDRKRSELDAVRMDVSTGATQSRANVKRQMQIEDEITKLNKVEEIAQKSSLILDVLSERLADNQKQRKGIPDSSYSESDLVKIGIFEKFFRANAGTFGYESAEIQRIRINPETLTPFFDNLELRVLADKSRFRDIRVDSSASDFVRLIWSYLLALYQASAYKGGNGNHPGILLLDEPGQHSMAANSQHALLQLLSAEKGLQSIVAASFDQSEAVFQEATTNVTFVLVEWQKKSIRKLS
jgi:hypothetical protein